MNKNILIFLSLVEISNKKLEKIMDIVEREEIKEIREVVDNKEIVNLLSTNEFANLVKKCNDRLFNAYLSNLENDNIKVVTIEEAEYPEKLRYLDDAPLLLYCKGDISLLNTDAISIVGTRMPSNYGKFVTEKFAGALASAGLTVVSGLAYGVDAISHRKTLEVNGKTIAVLGGGLNHIYPEANANLASEISEKGLLISEYPPFAKPTKYTFPLRNRIIAGLSLGTLITEAGKKSGTIHTKEYALEYGRDVFAVPGNINSLKSELPNSLIRSAQAECVLDPEDILSRYNIKGVKNMAKAVEVSLDEATILKLLEDGEQDFDELSKKSKLPTNILNSCLTTLEIRGIIKRMPAKTYMLS